jgi:hypothetical protein
MSETGGLWAGWGSFELFWQPGKLFETNYEYGPNIIANKQKHYAGYDHKISYQAADWNSLCHFIILHYWHLVSLPQIIQFVCHIPAMFGQIFVWNVTQQLWDIVINRHIFVTNNEHHKQKIQTWY